MDKNLANKDKRILWNKANLVELILLTPREAHLRASRDNKTENKHSNVIKISVIKVSFMQIKTNGIKAGVKINSMVMFKTKTNGRIISKIITNTIMRKQLIKWIQINLGETLSNQGSQYSNHNGKMIIGIKIKVIKSNPAMLTSEAVRTTLRGTACHGEKRVSKETTVRWTIRIWIMVWKVDITPIRI